MLLERDRELATLHALLRSAADGSGGVAVITGPPGAGKTALLEATRSAAGAYGLRDRHARGHEFEREIGFGIAAALVGPRAADRPADQVALHLYWQVAAESETTPLLLTVDDVHWCDAGSLQFLCLLTDRADELPVAMVLAARSRPDQLPTRPYVQEIPAAPLSATAIDRLVRNTLPDVDPTFTAACARMSGGNPFLLVELLRSLAVQGVAPTAAQVATTVPEAVLHSVLARLARLPAQDRRLAEAVAVLGDDVPLPRAAALAELELATAERAADALAAAHLLQPGAPLAFVHPLVGTTLHVNLPRFARSRAHREAAELLTADGEPPEAAAAHLLLTEPIGDERTVTLLAAAATSATRRGDSLSSQRLLRRALDEPPPPSRRAALLTDLAAVQFRAGDLAAEQTCADALALATDPARAHDVLAQIHQARGDHTGSAAHSAAALRLLPHGSPAWQDLMARHLHTAIFQPGRTAEVRSRIAAIADTGHPGLRTHCTLHRALTGEATSDEVVAHAAAIGAHPAIVSEDHGVLAGLLIHALALVDELAAAEEIADRAMAAAREHGAVIAYGNASFHRALCHYLRGSLTEAWADLDQARTVGAAGWPGAAGWIGELLVNIALDRGDQDAAVQAKPLIESAPHDTMEWPLCLAAQARLLLLDDTPEAASAAAAAAVEAGRLLRDGFGIDHPGLLAWRPLAALASHAAGDAGQARQLAAQGVARAEELGLARPLGIALHTAGLVAPAQAAVPVLTRAVAVLQRSPARLEHACALVSLGAALRRAGQQHAAREPLRQGLALADALGCGPVAAQARNELLASGARPRRIAVTGRAALTPTERRVADLAAAGRTNRQIAQTLFVTGKTVETHLTRIYRKLQITDRAALPAALAISG